MPASALATPALPRIVDRLMRAIGIPAFGIAIPNIAGLYGPYGPRDGIYWLGLSWFLLLAWTIWHSNRWLLFKQRGHVGWFGQATLKIIALVASIVFGTVPMTVSMLAAWYRMAAFGPIDWSAVRVVTLINVICVVFVTHVYETVFLIREREADLVLVERLEKTRAEAQLAALQAQLDPHFMFNALNTLAYLIAHDPRLAAEFNERLARVYRYILAQRERPVVLLGEEVDFLIDYAALLRLRFGDDAFRLDLESLDASRDSLDSPHSNKARDRRALPPMSLQLLLENAVKHNEVSRTYPLELRVTLDGDSIVVTNARRPRPLDRPSSGIGLSNLAERCRLVTRRELVLRSDDAYFTVILPLLEVA